MDRLIPTGRFELSQQTRREWEARPTDDTPYEQVLKDVFWQHVAKSLKPRDLIIVNPDGGRYWAELLVVTAHEAGVRVMELRKVDVDVLPADMAIPEGFKIEHGGLRLDWCAYDTRQKNKPPIKLVSGKRTQQDAYEALMKHPAVQRRAA